MDSISARRRRDLILEDALFKLADSELAKTLIFQGGGALHFIYSSPRYSSDLDFVDFTLSDNPDLYLERLISWGKKYDISRIKLISQFAARLKVGNKDSETLAKIEIGSKGAEEYTSSTGKFSPLIVKSPKDIYVDKIFANISRFVQRVGGNRFPFKPNDLFDLEYLVGNLGVQNVSRDDIVKRGNDYNQAQIINNDNIFAMLNLIRNSEKHDFFRHCIEKTMLPDVYKLIKFDSKYFDKAAEHFEQYLI